MKKIILILAICALPVMLLAQEQKSPKEREKEFYEAIEAQINQLTEQLELEDWQIFYVDSILTHDYNALREELKGLREAKISNSDTYQRVQDKWAEQIYNSLHKIMNEDQWSKYLKQGAARDKKTRDKRKAKVDEANAKLQ